MAKVQIEFEKLTLLGGIFRLWSYLVFSEYFIIL